MDSQLLLNGMLPPLKEFDRGIKANKDLEDQEKINLYQISCDCMNKGAAYNIKAALTNIAISYGDYFNRGKTLPFLLRQVIFCLTVHCLKYNKMNQKQVIEYLKKNGVTISHNFISRAKIKPTGYWKAYECDIPDPPVEYMGQKKGELGAAIRNLVYQAREYNTFIDLFGGSGAATASVMHLRGKNYIYNEVNPKVFSLFSTIVGSDYKKFIEAIEVLQDYIRTAEGVPINNSVNSDAEWWLMGKQGFWSEEDRKSMMDGDEQWRGFLCLYYFLYYSNLPALDQAVGEVFRHFFSIRGNVCETTVMAKIRGYYNRMGFYRMPYEEPIIKFHEAVKGTQCVNKDCFSLIADGDKTYLLYADPPYVATSEYEAVEIEKDSKGNKDLFTDEDLKKIQEESESIAGKFTDKEMENLIKNLISSGSKFIYSCRAVKSKNNNKSIQSLSKKKLEEIRSGNNRIYKSVFDVFKQNRKSGIYVLAIENFVKKDKNKEKTLAQRIKNCEVVELMITNYEIHSFMDIRYPRTIFRVYGLDAFLDIWNQNALV